MQAACLSVSCQGLLSQPSSHSRHDAASTEKKAPASWCSENPDEVDTLPSVAICPCCSAGSPQQKTWPLEGSPRVARQGLDTLQTRLRSDASLAPASPFPCGARTTTLVGVRGSGGVTPPLAPRNLCASEGSSVHGEPSVGLGLQQPCRPSRALSTCSSLGGDTNCDDGGSGTVRCPDKRQKLWYEESAGALLNSYGGAGGVGPAGDVGVSLPS